MIAKVLIAIAAVVSALVIVVSLTKFVQVIGLPLWNQYWNNHERFLSVQRLSPQLQLVPVSAKLLSRRQITQPQFLSTAVYVEYDYRLDRTISAAEFQSYYDTQLTKRGWVDVGGADGPHDAIANSADISLGGTQPGQHDDWLSYSAHYTNGCNGYYGGRCAVRELDLIVESRLNDSNN